MKNNYINSSFLNGWKHSAASLAMLAALAGSVQAQQGSSGNTTIFGGAEMTFFGNHNFTTGGSGTQPGIINTIRTSPMGVLNYGPSANTVTGANDANYVDGYVRKLGTTPFVFPVGDNGHYGPFAAAADGTTGAYFFTNPNSAVTSMLPSGNYPALPTGAPFATASKGAGVNTVSTIEYWDIDGTAATPITLTWDVTSAIGTLTGDNLSRLTIVGWNGTQWVAIPSAVDAASVLGTASDASSGSITTSGSIVPNTYTAYTFASAAPLIVQPKFTCTPGLSYIIGNRTVNGGLVSDGYVLDMVTGTATLAKSPLISEASGLFVNAIGYNVVDNYIWGYRYNTGQLVRIGSDWSVESFPFTGLPNGLIDIATGDVSPDGVLYLYPSGSSFMYKVDLNQGSTNYLKAIGLPTTASTGIINDWAFNPVDGLIYAFGTDHVLYQFDPVTGTRTDLGTITGGGIEGGGNFGTAFFDVEGNMFVGNNASGIVFKIATPASGNRTATVFSTINVTPGDGARCPNSLVAPTPPVATNDSKTTSAGTPVTVAIIGNDTPGSAALDPASVRLIDPVSGSAVTSVTVQGEGAYSVDPTTGEVTFTPVAGFVGIATTVKYTVADINGLVSNQANISITVTAVPPVASNDNGATTPGVAVEIATLGNDTEGSAAKDPASVLLIDPADGLKKTVVTIPGEGTYTVNTTTGAVTFVPVTGFNTGSSSISYTYKDINGTESNAATISISMGPLPVTLVSFTAVKEGQTALLTWSTTMETNSEKFDIEHSLSGKNWNRIGSAASNGESTVKRDYSFTHANLSNGENFYRLKMVDKDGTFAYSRIRSIESGPQVELSAYPNPVSDRLLIKNYTLVRELALYNSTGQKVLQSKGLTAQGIDLAGLGAGLYTAKITLADGSFSTQKIVVVK